MKFNNRDPNLIHPVISVSKEIYPSLPEREIVTVETASGELVAHVSVKQADAVIRMNVAGRSYDQAMEARLKLAEWAGSSHNRTAELEPTHLPGKAYTAILDRISTIENRFTTADVVFLIPRPFLHDIAPHRTQAEGTELAFWTGGTASTQPVFAVTPSNAADELRLTVDGVMFFAIGGGVSAGQRVEYNLRTGETTIDGIRAENRILYADIDPDIELLPGRHTLQSSVPGNLQVRWHDEWL